MRRALEWLREEFCKVLVSALFFSSGFCLVALANRLIVSGYNVPLFGFAKSVIGGLIVAKVLLVIDMLPFVDAFPHKPLAYNITWKTMVYTAGSLVYRYLEPFVKSLIAGAGLAASRRDAAQQFATPRFWAIQIWITVLLMIFVTMQELARTLGKENLRGIFLGRTGSRCP